MALEEIGGVSAAIEFQDRFSEPTARALEAIARLQDAIGKFRGGLGDAAKGMQGVTRGADAMARASAAMADAAAAFACAEADAGGIIDKMPAALDKSAAAFGRMQDQAEKIAGSMADAAKAAASASRAQLRVPGGGAPRTPGLPPGWPRAPRAESPFSGTSTTEPVGQVSAVIGGATEAYFKWTIASLIAQQLAGAAMGLLGTGCQILDNQASLAQTGLSKPEIAKATLTAEQLATQILGSTPSEALAGFMELRSVLGNNGEAMAALPVFLKNTMALLGRGLGGEGDMLKLVKALDVQGALKNAKGQLDPAKLQDVLHTMTAAMIASQGLLTPAMMLRFVQMAGPGIQNADLTDVLRSYVELLIGIGNRTGRGTGMAYLKLLGGQMTTAQLRAFENLGLINPKDVGGTKGHPFIDPDKLLGAIELREKGLGAWVEDVLFPQILKKYGKLDISTVERAIAQFPVSAQRVLAGFFTMGPQIKRFGGKGGLFDQALASDLLGSLMATGWTANVKNLSTAFETFIQVLSKPEADQAVKTLSGLANFFRSMTAWMLKDQERAAHGGNRVILPWWSPLPGNTATHQQGRRTLFDWILSIDPKTGKPFDWFGPLGNLQVQGQSPERHFGSAPAGTDVIWPKQVTVHDDSTHDATINVSAPLNVRIDGSLLGADYATLDFYMQGWIAKHAQEIGSAVEKTQTKNKRRTFLDAGGPLGAYAP